MMFRGSLDPKVAEDWIRFTDRIFQVMRCTDEKVLTTFSKQGEAQLWWEAKEQHYMACNQQVTWEMFKADLSKQYIPKAMDFINLVQGNMFVAKYESKFSELSHYAPHIVADEDEREKKFQQGLAPHIYEKITSFMIEDYFKAFEKEKASVIEKMVLGTTI